MLSLRARGKARKENTAMSKLLTLDEAATRLGINVSTMRDWVREGLIPAYRVGQRFTRVDWQQVLDAMAREVRHEAPTAGSGERVRSQ